MTTNNIILIVTTIIVVFYSSSCSTLGVVSKEQSLAIHDVMENLKIEEYAKAEEIINSAGDSSWNYYSKTQGSNINLPYIRVQKNKILGTISLQKELLESLRNQCNSISTTQQEDITALRTSMQCLKEGEDMLGEKSLIKDKTYKDLFVNIYSHQNTSVLDAPIGEQLPLPINESMGLIIRYEIRTLAKKIELLDNKLKTEKQESKECQILQSAFYTCNLINQRFLLQDEIDHQHKIGKISGYVNKEVLYQAGASLVILKPLLVQHKNEYKKLTGKNFDASICPKSESELYRKRAEACGLD